MPPLRIASIVCSAMASARLSPVRCQYLSKKIRVWGAGNFWALPDPPFFLSKWPESSRKPSLRNRRSGFPAGLPYSGLEVRKISSAARYSSSRFFCQRSIIRNRISDRPVLPVDLDTDKTPVENRRHISVFKRLSGHHVAPVAG